ncbi:MAG: competence/damage-inducible protein A [Candidatus Cloacimonadota bacterium]|nr:competence/damage-inducible protein A [Candidatus Cloacimonadota bacterium]
MLKIFVLTIGNEILQGKTVNTNLAFIGNELSQIGLQITSSATVKDEQESILQLLREANRKFDIIITTGGLGPTRDDLTKSCFANFFHAPLKLDDVVWNDIKKLYKNDVNNIPESAKSQAEVPFGCKIIRNEIGTAPGLHYESGNSHFFALPGVPAEMQRMMRKYIIPFLKDNFSLPTLYMKTIHTFGIRESKLSELIQNVQIESDVNIAFLPQNACVDIRLYSYDRKKYRRALGRIQAKARKYIFGYDDETLISVCHEKLIRMEKTLSVAESCTGGLIQNLFTDQSGSSKYLAGGVVSYSNRIKNEVLGVRSKTLDEFGAVSEQTVAEMLEGVQKKFNTDFSIAVSGVAGPSGGTKEKPVGLVYIGVNVDNKNTIQKFNFVGTRIQIKEKSALNAIDMLRKKLDIENEVD